MLTSLPKSQEAEVKQCCLTLFKRFGLPGYDDATLKKVAVSRVGEGKGYKCLVEMEKSKNDGANRRDRAPRPVSTTGTAGASGDPRAFEKKAGNAFLTTPAQATAKRTRC